MILDRLAGENQIFNYMGEDFAYAQWVVHRESSCNTGNVGSIPGLGRSPGGGMTTHSSILA